MPAVLAKFLVGATLATTSTAYVQGPSARPVGLRATRTGSSLQEIPLASTSAELPDETEAQGPWSWVAHLLGLGATLGLMAGILAPMPAKAITMEQFEQLTWEQVKGSGLANRCPTVDSVGTSIPVKEGSRLKNFCLEPKSFAVEAETETGKEFVTTHLLTRQTYTLAFIEGALKPNPVTFTEEEGMDFAATTVQLPNGERVPFLFTVKNLVATGEGSEIKPGFTWGGEFNVPSYRTGGFLDPKGRGMYTGYDAAQALPAYLADGKEGQDQYSKEANKVFDIGKGAIEMEVNKVNADLKEIGGVFVSKQPGDTDLGALAPKTILLKGIFYGKIV